MRLDRNKTSVRGDGTVRFDTMRERIRQAPGGLYLLIDDRKVGTWLSMEVIEE